MFRTDIAHLRVGARTCGDACRNVYSRIVRRRPDSRRRLELNDKRTVYAREGVEHLWLVDLAAHTLEAFELRESKWILVASAKNDDQVSIRPFETIKVSVCELWR